MALGLGCGHVLGGQLVLRQKTYLIAAWTNHASVAVQVAPSIHDRSPASLLDQTAQTSADDGCLQRGAATRSIWDIPVELRHASPTSASFQVLDGCSGRFGELTPARRGHGGDDAIELSQAVAGRVAETRAGGERRPGYRGLAGLPRRQGLSTARMCTW